MAKKHVVHSSQAEIEKKASSKTLNKSIEELEKLLTGERISTTSPLRQQLHDKLHELLRREALSWYRRGFVRGHETSRGKSSKVPKKISRPMRVKAVYLPKGGLHITLKSTIKP